MKSTVLKKIHSKLHNKYLGLVKTLSADNDLKRLINSKDIISFDIFDTVIVRKVLNPSDIFKIVEDLYTERYGKLEFKFTDIRIKAEPEATKIAANKSGAQCIDLDEIYEYIQLTQNLDLDIANRLKALEVETELNFCVRNEYMYSFYKYCNENNKKIIFTSDMYLPEEVITEILHNNGYTEFYQLFLSSVIRKSKHNGSLYSHILNELSCNASQMLHIGDYYYADIINTMKKGIKSYYYQKPCEYAFNRSDFKNLRELYSPDLSMNESIYFATIINKFFTKRNISNDISSYGFGYIYCGILYLGFINWLTIQLREQDIDKVFFLARDGYMMHKVYNQINQGLVVPSSEYMYASRRAINIPTIQNDIDEFSMKILCNFLPGLNVEGYLNRVHIDANCHVEKIRLVGFLDEKHEIKTTSDKHKLAQLFKNLSEEVCKNTAVEREYLVNYLDQIGFMNTDKIGIVDIGWRGTTQNALEKLMTSLNKKIEIKGFYFGTFSKAQEFVDKGFFMSGYACNLSIPKNNFDVMFGCVEMFEFIFSAPHGSVINFRKKNDVIEPICEPTNNSSKKSEMINEFQKGSIDFITDFMKTESNYLKMNIDAKSALNPISRILESPTYKEAVHFGNLTHSEYIGKNKYERYFARISETWWVILNPIKLRRVYYSTVWKCGFKKRYLGFLIK